MAETDQNREQNNVHEIRITSCTTCSSLWDIAAMQSYANQETNMILGQTRASIVSHRDLQKTSFSPTRN